MLTLHRLPGDVTRVHLTHWRSRVAGYSVSAYLVRGVLIDTGYPAARADLARVLDELRPRGAIVTHVHEDHAGNAALVAQRGLPLAVAPETLALLREGEARVGFYRRFTWDALPPLTAPVSRWAPDALADLGFALVPTPGHSSDHHVVWDAERATMYGGDLFLSVKVRIARPDEDPRTLVRSLRAAAALGPRVFYDAHRGPIDDPVGALLAKADWIEGTIARIDRLTSEGWSEAAITREVLGAEDLVRWVSRGDLSKRNFVRVVRASGARG